MRSELLIHTTAKNIRGLLVSWAKPEILFIRVKPEVGDPRRPIENLFFQRNVFYGIYQRHVRRQQLQISTVREY